jgi:hypothetical protein
MMVGILHQMATQEDHAIAFIDEHRHLRGHRLTIITTTTEKREGMILHELPHNGGVGVFVWRKVVQI